MSVLERCPYKRGHYDDVTFSDSTYSFKCPVSNTRLKLVFKLHFNLLITKNTLSFSSIQHCSYIIYSDWAFEITLHSSSGRLYSPCADSPDRDSGFAYRLSVRNKEVKFI